MKKFKGTKGEWSYCDSELNPAKHNFSIVANNGTRLVADIYKRHQKEAREAIENAKLISAAPELLKACLSALEIIDLWLPSSNTVNEQNKGEAIALSDMEYLLKKAINKALYS